MLWSSRAWYVPTCRPESHKGRDTIKTLPLVLVLVLVLVLISQTPALAQGPAADDAGLAARMNRLEAETDTLRNELQWLRENPVRLPAIEATPASAANNLAPADGGGDYFTLAELQAEMKKHAWTKGDFRIVPYGFLWGNMVYSSARTTPGSYTLYVPSATLQPDNKFVVDARIRGWASTSPVRGFPSLTTPKAAARWKSTSKTAC